VEPDRGSQRMNEDCQINNLKLESAS